jgi:hypothetical protein
MRTKTTTLNHLFCSGLIFIYFSYGTAIPETTGGEAETTESNVKLEDRKSVGVEYISAMRPIRGTSETFLQYIFCVTYKSLIWKSQRKFKFSESLESLSAVESQSWVSF